MDSYKTYHYTSRSYHLCVHVSTGQLEDIQLATDYVSISISFLFLQNCRIGHYNNFVTSL